MKLFFEVTYGPAELEILNEVLSSWLAENGLTRESVEAEIAAAVLINLFREGSTTVPTLRDAARRHRGLIDLGRSAA